MLHATCLSLAVPPYSVGLDQSTDLDITEWAGLSPLDENVHADVCVVGLGGSGLAAVEEAIGQAWRLGGGWLLRSWKRNRIWVCQSCGALSGER